MANSNVGTIKEGARKKPDAPAGQSMMTRYKPDQGRGTRIGSLIGGGAMIAWGGVWLKDRLAPYTGDDDLVAWGCCIALWVVLGALLYWYVYAGRKTSDFLIATEGEMKKVNWSSRSEITGSTKVVILFVVLLASLLFLFDLGFQNLFQWLGVLKTG